MSKVLQEIVEKEEREQKLREEALRNDNMHKNKTEKISSEEDYSKCGHPHVSVLGGTPFSFGLLMSFLGNLENDSSTLVTAADLRKASKRRYLDLASESLKKAFNEEKRLATLKIKAVDVDLFDDLYDEWKKMGYKVDVLKNELHDVVVELSW